MDSGVAPLVSLMRGCSERKMIKLKRTSINWIGWLLRRRRILADDRYLEPPGASTSMQPPTIVRQPSLTISRACARDALGRLTLEEHALLVPGSSNRDSGMRTGADMAMAPNRRVHPVTYGRPQKMGCDTATLRVPSAEYAHRTYPFPCRPSVPSNGVGDYHGGTPAVRPSSSASPRQRFPSQDTEPRLCLVPSPWYGYACEEHQGYRDDEDAYVVLPPPRILRADVSVRTDTTFTSACADRTGAPSRHQTDWTSAGSGDCRDENRSVFCDERERVCKTAS
ncbi:hypothetical protein C8R47DRAFT_1322453 [Mycena vitilis]|nr:hypothetical protein C8R47DRAFT_1322453 [Mycena vitilis]